MSEDFRKTVTFAIVSAERDLAYEAIRNTWRVYESAVLHGVAEPDDLHKAIEKSLEVLPEYVRKDTGSKKREASYDDILG